MWDSCPISNPLGSLSIVCCSLTNTGHPYNHPLPKALTPELTIQFIEFTYCNDRFVAKTLNKKTTKYQPLINNITTRGWNVAPLMVLVARARATTHIPSMKSLETKLKFLVMKIKSFLKQINTITKQYTHFILVYKQCKRESIRLLVVNRNILEEA